MYESGILSIAQPDFPHCAGLMEANSLSAVADLYYTRIAPHNSSGPVATIGSVHVDATLSNLYMQEYIESTMFEDLFLEYPRIEDGAVILDDAKPGFGLVPDWEKMESLTAPVDEGATDW